jgi:hypothetical protein
MCNPQSKISVYPKEMLCHKKKGINTSDELKKEKN